MKNKKGMVSISPNKSIQEVAQFGIFFLIFFFALFLIPLLFLIGSTFADEPIPAFINASEYWITDEGALNNTIDVQGKYITNNLNWINETQGDLLYYLVSNPEDYISDLDDFTTSDLDEGTHLYFTNARAISALDGEDISMFNNDVGYISNLNASELYYKILLDAANITSGTFTDARISESSVTQYESDLSILRSQVDGFFSLPFWDNIPDLPTLESNLILFGNFSSDSNLIWDNPNKRLGIGTASPNQKLTIEGTFSLKEQSTANTDTSAYGQIWVKNTVPTELWFTDDAGGDHQIINQSAGEVTSIIAGDGINVDTPTGAVTISAKEGATKEFMIMPFHKYESYTLSVGGYGVYKTNSAGRRETSFNFVVPADFTSLTSANILVIPDATETIQWDEYISVATTGEDYNIDDRSTLDVQQAVTINDLTQINMTGNLNGIVAGDYIGITLKSDIDYIRTIGLHIKYS